MVNRHKIEVDDFQEIAADDTISVMDNKINKNKSILHKYVNDRHSVVNKPLMDDQNASARALRHHINCIESNADVTLDRPSFLDHTTLLIKP